jgi:hypothetical protein
MIQDKRLNVTLLLFSLLAIAVQAFAGEAVLNLLVFVWQPLRTAIWLTMSMGFLAVAVMLAEMIHPGGYTRNWQRNFFGDRLKILLVFIPLSFAVGFLTQFLYGFISVRSYEADFQGTFIVCDVSGSMQGNDPDRYAIDAICDYVDTVPAGDYLGVIVYSDNPIILRNYTVLSDDERETLKETVRTVYYSGNTNIMDPLVSAIDQIRTVSGSFPGLILLLADGDGIIDETALRKLARGNINEPTQQIPVNTLSYANGWGMQMRKIAEMTGGTYSDIEGNVIPVDVFEMIRSSYRTENPDLLRTTYGVTRDNPIRIIAQILIVFAWGMMSVMFVYLLLNNNLLKVSFVIPKAIFAFVCAAAFTFLLLLTGEDVQMEFWLRLIPTAMICLLFIPTYTIRVPMNQTGEEQSHYATL